MAKILLVWAEKGPEFKHFMEELTNTGHDIVYWVGSVGGEKYKLPGTIFHSHMRAWDGKPSLEINKTFDPPSVELLQKMESAELTILSMMNKHFDAAPVDERRHIYNEMVGYWYGILMTQKPDVIIFPIVPHSVYNYIILELGKLLGKKIIMFEDPWVGNRIIHYRNWQEGNLKLQNKIEEYKNRQFHPEDLAEDLKKYYLHQVNPEGSAEPEYMGIYRKQFSGWQATVKNNWKAFRQALGKGEVFGRSFRKIKKRFIPDLKKDYEKLIQTPDLTTPFVYVPLGFQPERVSSPQGGAFVDQILMIEILSAALPQGWVIYVKEHPTQWWLRNGIAYSSSRYPGYYKRIASIKNVQLVPISFNSLSLVEQSKAVATVTGTAGWEAVLRLKPALIFGYPWYRDFPALFRISSPEHCRKAFEKIQNGFSFGQKDILSYLKAFDETTIKGFLEYVTGEKRGIGKEESFANVLQVILREI